MDYADFQMPPEAKKGAGAAAANTKGAANNKQRSKR